MSKTSKAPHLNKKQTALLRQALKAKLGIEGVGKVETKKKSAAPKKKADAVEDRGYADAVS